MISCQPGQARVSDLGEAPWRREVAFRTLGGCCQTPGRSSRDHASSETRRNAQEKGIGKNSYLCRHLDPSCGVRGDPAS
eukprot:329745-Rhodomonas_salina.1